VTEVSQLTGQSVNLSTLDHILRPEGRAGVSDPSRCYCQPMMNRTLLHACFVLFQTIAALVVVAGACIQVWVAVVRIFSGGFSGGSAYGADERGIGLSVAAHCAVV
jgi:hypothetical protein